MRANSMGVCVNLPVLFFMLLAAAGAARGDADQDVTWLAIYKVGVRPARMPPARQELKIALSKPWKIPSVCGRPQNRPYMYNVGRGMLLMSVAQGPDKEFEPYGILKSTDEGKTWTPVEGMQRKMFAP